MPFTISHAAAILPAKRYCPQHLNFPALVCGSMIPDLGYYLHEFPLASFAHTVVGSFAIDLPAGLALMVLFYLFRAPFVWLLPSPHRELLTPICEEKTRINPLCLTQVSVSILIGSWTHIFWDGFTHANGWFVQRIGVLKTGLFSIQDANFAVYNVLQHLSSAIGFLILIFFYFRWVRQHQTISSSTSNWRGWFWVAMFVSPILPAFFSSQHILFKALSFGAFQRFGFIFIVNYLQVGFLTLLASTLFACLLRMRKSTAV